MKLRQAKKIMRIETTIPPALVWNALFRAFSQRAVNARDLRKLKRRWASLRGGTVERAQRVERRHYGRRKVIVEIFGTMPLDLKRCQPRANAKMSELYPDAPLANLID